MIRHMFSAKGRSFVVACYGKSKTAISLPYGVAESELIECYQEELGRLVRENAALRKTLANRAAICHDAMSRESAANAPPDLTPSANLTGGGDRG